MQDKKAAATTNSPLKITFINDNKEDLSVILGKIFGQEILKQQQKEIQNASSKNHGYNTLFD